MKARLELRQGRERRRRKMNIFLQDASRGGIRQLRATRGVDLQVHFQASAEVMLLSPAAEAILPDSTGVLWAFKQVKKSKSLKRNR